MLTVSASNLRYCEFGEKSERLCASCISRGDQGDRLSASQVIEFGPLLSPDLLRPLSSHPHHPCSMYTPRRGLFVLFPGPSSPVPAASTLTLGWAHVIFFSCLNRHSMNCLSDLFSGLKLNDKIEKLRSAWNRQQRALLSPSPQGICVAALDTGI